MTPDAFSVTDALREHAALDSLTPCFVIGPMKSGTTWLARALAEHPRIASSYESHAADVLLPRLGAAIDDYHATIDAWGRGPSVGLGATDALLLRRVALDRLLLRYLRESGKPADRVRVVADKTPMHALHVDELAALYPRARFILCTRDVRDAAVSAWKHLHELSGHRKGATFEEYARHYARDLWARPVRAAMESFSRLARERWMTVEYEAHKADPRSTLREVFAFLGVDSDDATTGRIADATDFRRFSGRPAGEERAMFYRKGVVGDWENHMTPELGEELTSLAITKHQDARAHS
ncbi:MAG: sulfotransferase [Phycisphaeraceae bacterium]|nr:sulfotransferase [Phycisphaeraceae bacterium]